MMRACIWLVEHLVRDDVREEVVGDLIEARHRGAWWMIRQTLGALWHLRARLEHRTGDGIVMNFLADLRIAARLLRRSPTFTIASVLTLGLAIGATTAIFSVTEPVLIRPLPYSHPERLALVWERGPDGSRDNIGYATFKDLQTGAATIESAAAIGEWQPTLTSHGEPERVAGSRVSWTYFRMLGIHPAIGRDFTVDEDAPGKTQVVMLSHGLWARRYGRDPSIVGHAIAINGLPYVVAGVMPASFDNVLSPTDQLWRPLGYLNQPYACRTCRHLRMVARIRSNIEPSAARAELDQLMGRLAKEYPKEYGSVGALVLPVQSEMALSYRPVLLALAGAVTIVLLIAIANAVNLQLARAVRREEEFAIRTALGARRSRLLGQLLTEALLLSLLGGAAGVVVAWIALPLLVAQLPPAVPRLSAIHLDAGALAVTAAIIVGITLAIGFAPARQTGDLGETLRSTRRTTSGRHVTRSALVATEVALAVMLLIAGGLVARSLIRLLAVDPGFDATHLLSLEFNAVGPAYQDNARVYAYHERVREAVRALPGVVDVATTNQLPMAGNVDRYGVTDPDNVPANPELVPYGDRYVVSGDFLRTMRIPIIRGRGFTAIESADTNARIALISDGLAKRLWPGQDPIGKKIWMGGETRPTWTIVGVAGNVRHDGLDARLTQQWYLPEGTWFGGADNQETLIVRTKGDPAAMAGVVRAAVAAIDPTQAITKVATMDQLIATTVAQRRLALALFAAFATTALLLAVAGIYGVLAGSVAERTREIGVRSALGATPGDIVALVVKQGGRLALSGILIGLLASAALSRLLETLLYDIQPTDPMTLIGVTVLLGAVTLLACLIPAQRAARVDPSRALRAD